MTATRTRRQAREHLRALSCTFRGHLPATSRTEWRGDDAYTVTSCPRCGDVTAERLREDAVVVDGLRLVNVHTTCDGPCVIHRPSEHHLRAWPLHWRGDRGIFERICEHGIGHPDPDQFAYWRRTGQHSQDVHGCCGCCVARRTT